MQRGDIWWADLDPPAGSEPGYRRPVLVVQADAYNASAIPTVIVAVLTSNAKLADAPGNVLVKSRDTKLNRDSVVNVSALLTINRSRLAEFVAPLAASKLAAVDRGLRRVLGL